MPIINTKDIIFLCHKIVFDMIISRFCIVFPFLFKNGNNNMTKWTMNNSLKINNNMIENIVNDKFKKLPYALWCTFDSTSHGDTSTFKATNFPNKFILWLKCCLASKCRMLNCRSSHFFFFLQYEEMNYILNSLEMKVFIWK